ncbi:MAG TPA: AAA family ATPase [Myxococcota bacterium]|nr:AAA family ATPase [Myxococcota bacterium]
MAELLERDGELAAIASCVRAGGVLSIEAGAGMGKTSLVDAACALARRRGRAVLRARGSDLEREFAFGVVRQLFEARCAAAGEDLLRGPARAAAPLVGSARAGAAPRDTSFAVVHGLYWLAVQLADREALLLAVDDAHWADDASLRWLAYLAPRLEGRRIALVVALRPDEPASHAPALAALRRAATVIKPQLLSREAVAALVRKALGSAGSDLDALAHRATGGNPFYLRELLRAAQRGGDPRRLLALEEGVGEAVALHVRARLTAVDPAAARLAQALATLGDGCELRLAAQLARLTLERARRLASELIALEVLGADDPARFIHPVVRQAVAETLSNAERDAAHRAAARVLHADGAPAGLVAAHLVARPGASDGWVVERLREAAREAVDQGSPSGAAALLERALREPPAAELRVELLREAARAEQLAGRDGACQHLAEALALTAPGRERTELASALAQAHAALFRWTDAVVALEDALAGARGPAALELEGQLAAIGLQDARTARRAVAALARLSRRRLTPSSRAALALGQGLLAVLTARPADESVPALLTALAAGAGESWDALAAALWGLVTAERFDAVAAALQPLRERAERTGSSRGLFAVHSSLALLQLKLGDLAEADAAARVAFRVAGEGDFAAGLPFAATVLAEIAVANGELGEAETLLAPLTHEGLPAGVGSALVPAARGRLRLAQGRAAEALCEFDAASALWQPGLWGIPIADAGYLHARSGAALAALALGDVRRARALADAELADARRFGGRRAVGVALRASGLARGGSRGLRLLEQSAALLAESPARLEHAASLVALGGALRRAGRRVEARDSLLRGLDAAARCGARPLAASAREELRIAGARPRRDRSVGVEALTASELRVVRLARDGRTNREIAQELYVAIKTVEGHLARAYGKLGVRRRDELARVLPAEKSRVAPL